MSKCNDIVSLLSNVSVGYDPVGLSIPYTGILEDPRDELSTISLHVFLTC